MIDLGSTDFRIAVPTLERDEFERYTTSLFEDWEAHVSGSLSVPDYSLLLQVEEGSIKGWGKVAAVIGAVYIGIGEYGDFISGVQQIRNQLTEVGTFLADRAHESLGPNVPEPKVRRHGGALAQLHRLFVRVQRQEISIDDAIRQAESILGDDTQIEPRFISAFKDSLLTAPLLPKQLDLPLEEMEVTSRIPLKDDRVPRPSLPSPPHIPPLQLRVEVWRESRNGKRKVRVTEI